MEGILKHRRDDMEGIKELEIKVHLPENLDNKIIYISKDNESLGSGAYGTVYKVTDTNNSLIAFKVIRIPIDTEDKKTLKKLETALLKELFVSEKIKNYEHIGKVFCFGVVEWESIKKLCLLSEFIVGRELKEALKEEWKHTDKLNFLEQISKGIKEIHDVGIVHRDLTTRNIMVTEKNTIKVIDFGISFFLDATLSTMSLTTDITGRQNPDEYLDKPRGNPRYIAPEMWEPEKYEGKCGLEYDKEYELFTPIYPSDIWAFGIIVYEMYVGRPPFPGSNNNIISNAVCNKEIPWPQSIDIDISVKELIVSCLEKDPEKRPTIGKILEIIGKIKENSAKNELGQNKIKLRNTFLGLPDDTIIDIAARFDLILDKERDSLGNSELHNEFFIRVEKKNMLTALWDEIERRNPDILGKNPYKIDGE